MKGAYNALKIEKGMRFGRLTIIEEIEKVNKSRVFRCKCDCGSIKDIKIHLLTGGKTTSCGCLKKEYLKNKYDNQRGSTIIGLRNGSWEVISQDKKMYFCKCVKCGIEMSFNESSFKNGGIRNCCDPVNRGLKYYCRQLRSSISMALKRNYNKTQKTEKLLGKSIKEVLTDLESKFKPGMNWKERNKWEIDHICPMSQAKNKEEAEKLQHFSNLTPLWKYENNYKQDSWSPEGEDMCLTLLGRKWIYDRDEEN